MRFTNFYAGNTVCAPSRAVLLTGKQSDRVSIRGNAGYLGNDKWEGFALDRDEFTLGEMMNGAGYKTAFIGKWHLDHPDDVETWAYGHGFDYAVQEQWTARFGGREFPPNRLWINGDQDFVPYDYTQYDCKDELRTDLAFDFLNQLNADQPFFLFMSYLTPHSFEGPIRDTLYADQGWPETERVHAAKITLLDKQVGRLLDKLDEMGVLENTLVMFTSDNGPHFSPGGHDLEFFDSNGKLIVQVEAKQTWGFSEGLAAVAVNSQKWGFIDTAGKWAVPASFRWVDSFSQGLAKVEVRHGRQQLSGFINADGTLVIEPVFSIASPFCQGLAAASLSDDDPYGYINRHGKWKIQPQFESAEDFSEGLAVVQLDHEVVYIDKRGEVALRRTSGPPWGSADAFQGGLAMLYYDDGFAYIDNTGAVVWSS